MGCLLEGGGYLIDVVQTDDNLVIGGKPMRYKLVIPTNIPNIKSEMKLCHHYNNDDFNVIQLLWADGNNLLLSEDGYSDTGQIVF